MENAKQQTGVPENAFRELKKDEQYEPLMSPERTYKEVTVWYCGACSWPWSFRPHQPI